MASTTTHWIRQRGVRASRWLRSARYSHLHEAPWPPTTSRAARKNFTVKCFHTHVNLFMWCDWTTRMRIFTSVRRRSPYGREVSKRALGPAPREWLRPGLLRDADESAPASWRRSPFGSKRLLDSDWQTGATPQEQAAIDAAKRQHAFALIVRNEVRTSREDSTESLAAEIGMSVGGLRRLMNGTAHLTLIDFFRIAAALDHEAFIGVRRPRTGAPSQSDTRA